MKLNNIIVALLCTIASFFLIELVYGESGLTAFHKRSEVVEALQNNVNQLRHKNQTLQSELAALQNNTEYVLSLSVKSGYFKENQGLIITDGNYSSSFIWEIGHIKYVPSFAPVKRAIRIGAAVTLGLIMYIFVSIPKESKQQRSFKLLHHRHPAHRAV